MSNENELAKFAKNGLAAQAAVDALLSNATPGSQPQRHYAVAVKGADGRFQEVSGSFTSPEAAQQELAQLVGDDHYRDRDPFVVTRIEEPWTVFRPSSD